MFIVKVLAFLAVLPLLTDGCLSKKYRQLIKDHASFPVQNDCKKLSPELTEPLHEVSVKVGESAEFECRLSSIQNIGFVGWLHGTNVVGLYNRDDDGSWKASTQYCDCRLTCGGQSCLFRINNVNAEVAGDYICKARRRDNSDVDRTFRLNVIEPTWLFPQNVQDHREDYVTLSCGNQMARPFLFDKINHTEWLFGSTVLNDSTTWPIHQKTLNGEWQLIIPRALVKDSGTYTCKMYGEDENYAQTVELLVSPIPRNLKVFSVKTGENVTLACSVKVVPGDWMLVEWRSKTWLYLGYDTLGIYGRRPAKGLETNTEWYEVGWRGDIWNLYLVNVTSKRAGEYHCTARYEDNRMEKQFFQVNVVLENGTTVMTG